MTVAHPRGGGQKSQLLSPLPPPAAYVRGCSNHQGEIGVYIIHARRQLDINVVKMTLSQNQIS